MSDMTPQAMVDLCACLSDPEVLLSIPQPHRLRVSELLHGATADAARQDLASGGANHSLACAWIAEAVTARYHDHVAMKHSERVLLAAKVYETLLDMLPGVVEHTQAKPFARMHVLLREVVTLLDATERGYLQWDSPDTWSRVYQQAKRILGEEAGA